MNKKYLAVCVLLIIAGGCFAILQIDYPEDINIEQNQIQITEKTWGPAVSIGTKFSDLELSEKREILNANDNLDKNEIANAIFVVRNGQKELNLENGEVLFIN